MTTPAEAEYAAYRIELFLMFLCGAEDTYMAFDGELNRSTRVPKSIRSEAHRLLRHFNPPKPE
jgi:hypothetical protein